MKCERLIYVQTSIDVEMHLGMVRVLNGSQEADVLVFKMYKYSIVFHLKNQIM